MGVERPLDGEEYGRWLASADRALLIAGDLHGLSRHEMACFLAEQAAQLGLKALLRGVGVPSFGHELLDLGRRLEHTLDARVPADVGAALTRLSRYYIPTRYPDAWAGGTPADHYGPDDSSSALHDAQQVLTTVRSVWEQLQTAAEDGQVGDAD